MTFPDDWVHHISQPLTLSSAETGLPVIYTFFYGAGTDTGNTIYCNNECNADFSDIRFANNLGTKLPYHIESFTSGVSAVIWVKVDSIDSDSEIHVYYGNPSATSESSGTDTFDLFDDFTGTSLDTAKWTTNTGDVSLADGSITCLNTAITNITGN